MLEGKFPPLIIHPEGGVTNGLALVKFAKGAFVGLQPVMPVGIKYHSLLIDMSNGSVPFESHFVLVACNPAAVCVYNEYPVFTPNDYFFKNHQKEGEEKHETYARIVQKIIAE